MLSERTLRARRSASRLASSSTARTIFAMSWRTSSSARFISSSVAWAVVRPEMRSNAASCSACCGPQLFGEPGVLGLALAYRLVSPIELADAGHELLFTLGDALLGLGQLGAPVAQLVLHLAAHSVELFLGLDARLFERRLGLALRVLQDPIGFALGPCHAALSQ